jgi:uncharacterized membrane protein YeaQ/YmgE (transglycosylase-associated protein family)
MDVFSVLLTVVPIAWGLVVKYHPAWAKVPNAIIPYATFLVALLTKLVVPDVAQAGVFGFLHAGAVGGVLGHALSAGWTAIQNSLIYEVFLRHPANAVLTKN